MWVATARHRAPTADGDADENGETNEDEGSTADLVTGAQVSELELDDDSGAFERVTLYPQP